MDSKMVAGRVRMLWAIGVLGAFAVALLLSGDVASAPAAEPLKVAGLPVT